MKTSAAHGAACTVRRTQRGAFRQAANARSMPRNTQNNRGALMLSPGLPAGRALAAFHRGHERCYGLWKHAAQLHHWAAAEECGFHSRQDIQAGRTAE